MNSPDLDRARRSSANDRLIAATASTFACVATFVATSQGPGLNPDSANYLSAGQSLAAGRGLVTFGGGTMTIFPPGLPALIALGTGLGASAELTLRLLNASAFAATVWLTFVLLRRHVRSTWLVRCGTVLTAVSTPLLTMAEMVWTESVFIVICLGLILALEEALRSARKGAWIVAAVLLTWCAFLVRYAGISLVAAGSAALLLGFGLNRSWREGFRWAFGFGAAASAVPIAWMVRNLAVDGTLMGPRSPSVDEPIGTSARFVATLGRWVLPSPTPVVVQAAMGVVVLCLGAAVAVATLRRTPRRTADEPLPGTAPSLVPLLTVTAVYSVYLISAQLTAAFDKIGNRLMSPLVAPCTVLLFVVLDRGVDLIASKHPAAPVRPVLGTVLVALLIGHGIVFADHAATSARDAVGYRQSAWRESDLMDAVRRLPNQVTLYSNAPSGLWTATGREPIWPSPARRAYRSSERVPLSQDFLRHVSCDDAYLVWFDEIPGDFLYSPSQLAEVVDLSPIADGAAGSLYRLSAQDPSTSECGR